MQAHWKKFSSSLCAIIFPGEGSVRVWNKLLGLVRWWDVVCVLAATLVLSFQNEDY